MKNKYTYNYPRPSITGDVIIYDSESEEFLFIERKFDPHKGKLAIVGGFFNPDPCEEGQDISIKAGAIRELREEVNIDLSKFKFGRDYVFSLVTVQDDPNRDTRGRVISFVYALILLLGAKKEKLDIKAQDDASKIIWINHEELLEKINANAFAFDHADSIRKFLERDER